MVGHAEPDDLGTACVDQSVEPVRTLASPTRARHRLGGALSCRYQAWERGEHVFRATLGQPGLLAFGRLHTYPHRAAVGVRLQGPEVDVLGEQARDADTGGVTSQVDVQRVRYTATPAEVTSTRATPDHHSVNRKGSWSSFHTSRAGARQSIVFSTSAISHHLQVDRPIDRLLDDPQSRPVGVHGQPISERGSLHRGLPCLGKTPRLGE